MLKNFFLIFTFIMVASSYELEEDDDYFEDEIGPSQYENLKMTDVLKMVVLPSAQEISNILTSEDNTTGEPANPQKLEFILHAIDYWRKHNIPEDLEDVKEENITKVTFNLRDDFFDDDGSQYSRLSKKLQPQSKDFIPGLPENWTNGVDTVRNLPEFKQVRTIHEVTPFIKISDGWKKDADILPEFKQLRTVYTKAPIPKVPDSWTKDSDIKSSLPEFKQLRTIYTKDPIPKVPDSWTKDSDIKSSLPEFKQLHIKKNPVIESSADIEKTARIEKRSAPMPYIYVKNLYIDGTLKKHSQQSN